MAVDTIATTSSITQTGFDHWDRRYPVATFVSTSSAEEANPKAAMIHHTILFKGSFEFMDFMGMTGSRRG